MTICDIVVLKVFIAIKIKIMLLYGVDMQQDEVFSNLIWWKQMTDMQNENNRH